MPPLKIAWCWTSALKNSAKTASTHSPNTFIAEKKTLTLLPISRSEISSRCETKLHQKHFGQKRNWITRWKQHCPEYTCRFTQWSLSHEFLIRQRQDVPDSKIEFSTLLLSRSSSPGS